jgi:GDPmannose 4,6-dehydratase
MPRAFITGITGQDGSYLAELLLAKGYEVHGLVRRPASLERSPLKDLCRQPDLLNRRLYIHPGDMNDPASLREAVRKSAPDEVYHLAGPSHVGLSFDMAETMCEITGLGTLRLLDCVRGLPRPARFLHAASSEIFGRPEHQPQDETTPFRPANPYGCAKAFATQMVSIYREQHRLFAGNAILYNHESPRRGGDFVTQKICRAAAAIKLGRQRELLMGSRTARRDWGDARDYVRGMWLALQQDRPDDFVFATGELHSVQEVVEIAFEAVGLNWADHVKEDPRFLRPEPDKPVHLVGNAGKAERLLGWRPTARFKDLILEMVHSALADA